MHHNSYMCQSYFSDMVTKVPQASRVIWDPSKYIHGDEQAKDAEEEHEEPQASAVRLTGIQSNQSNTN